MAGISQSIWGDGGTNSGAVTQAPAQNYGQETRDTLQAQVDLAPQQYQSYAQYAPQYAQTNVNALGTALLGSNYNGGSLTDINNQVTSQANQQTADSNKAALQSNLANVSQFSPQIQSALQQANPQYFSALAQQQAAAQRGITQSPYESQMANQANSSVYNPVSLNQQYAPTVDSSMVRQGPGVRAQQVQAPQGNGTLNTLQSQYAAQPGLSTTQSMADQQAQALLGQGGNLSGQELRDVQQSSRAAYASRGLDESNGSIGNEVLNTDAAQRARLLENVNTAEGIETNSQNQRMAQQNFGLGVSGQLQNYGQMGLNAQQSNQQANLQSGLANQQNSYQTQLANQQAGLTASTANAGFNYQTQAANNANLLAQQQANLSANNQQYNQLGALSSLDQNRQMQNFTLGQQNLANYAASIFDPTGAILGQASTNIGNNGSLLGMASQSNAGTNANTLNMFNPSNQYASSMYNSNANIASQANLGSAANKTSQINNVVSADGSTANAIIGKL